MKNNVQFPVSCLCYAIWLTRNIRTGDSDKYSEYTPPEYDSKRSVTQTPQLQQTRHARHTEKHSNANHFSNTTSQLACTPLELGPDS